MLQVGMKSFFQNFYWNCHKEILHIKHSRKIVISHNKFTPSALRRSGSSGVFLAQLAGRGCVQEPQQFSVVREHPGNGEGRLFRVQVWFQALFDDVCFTGTCTNHHHTPVGGELGGGGGGGGGGGEGSVEGRI